MTISNGFWLGKCEITQGQWESAMATTPWAGIGLVQANPQHPAVYISWNDVQDLISHPNHAAGGRVYRLPTEAEWEYACRAGTPTRWSFGDDEGQLEQYAWYYSGSVWEAGFRDAQPVGTKLPNPWGLFDMHGNVHEWVQDRYGSYSGDAQVDPQGPSTGSLRVFRGGDSGYNARYTRSAFRYFFSPDRRYFLGARILRRE